MQTGASPANAIRASRTNTLHRQAVCKTANPSDLHAAESCSSGDVHVRISLAVFEGGYPSAELYEREVVMSSLYRLSSDAVRLEKLEA